MEGATACDDDNGTFDVFNKDESEDNDAVYRWDIDELLSSEDENDIDRNRGDSEQYFKEYNFRQRFREKFASTHISFYDDDLSGTFQPESATKKLKRVKPCTAPKKTRKYKTCTECRSNGAECSLKEWVDEAPCDSCFENGVSCTFHPLRDAAKKNNTIDVVILDESETSDDEISVLTVDDLPMDYDVPAAVVQTGLSHPVTFFTRPGDCHWCTHPGYGLMMPKVCENVRTRPTTDGRHWRELRGGNREKGKQASRMCIQCSAKRIRIILCQGHQISIHPGLQTKKQVSKKEIEETFKRLARNQVRAEDKFCTLCLNVSRYSCRRPHEKDAFGDQSSGCGMELCEFCFQGVKKCSGSFKQYLANLLASERDKEKYPVGPRADAELLYHRSLLMKNLAAIQVRQR